MRRNGPQALFLAFLAIVASPTRAADVNEVFQKFVAAAEGTSWPTEAATRGELKKEGNAALPLLLEGANSHASGRVRRSCYEALINAFPRNEQVSRLMIEHSLTDPEPAVRYQCAFVLGDWKTEAAVAPLRIVLEKRDHDTAAKALAQLGQAGVLRDLYQAAASDHYMPRHMADIGLKELSGKNLNDFEGYNYGEGAMVSGGHAYITIFDAVTDTERKVKRYQALLSYFRWLQQERPELYRHVTGKF